MQIRIFYPYFVVILLLIPLFLYWIRYTPRRLSPLRRRLLISLRLVVFALLVGGLVRLSLTQAYEQANVVFLLDMSQSIATAVRQQALAFLRTVSENKRPQDGVGLVVFGADASVEQTVSSAFTLRDIAAEVDGTSTNIARAIQIGLASFPPEGARRLVLLSDGNENVGAAADAALIARSLGAEIFAVPLGRPPGEPEVRVENLLVPAQVKVGTPYRVEAVVFSTLETPVTLQLFRGDTFVGQQEVTLQPGKNRYSFLQNTAEEGVHLYQLVVNSPQDTIPDNNRWHAYTEVQGPPKVLLLYDPPGDVALLAEALRQQGLAVQERPWSELSHTLSGYLEYDALIFANVPSFGISVSQMEVLERYVRDMGGGLLMLGGDKSFGAGGYYRTPLEKILPVDMDVPTKMSIPSLCLVMVLDKSDSMGGSLREARPVQPFEERTTKLEVAKIAAFSAMKLLNPFDQVGVLAFNADWEWTVPITEAGKREQIAGRLASLTHAGGTDMYKAMAEGLRALKDIKAVKKHLIALSDGLTPNMDFESLMRDALANNITVTTVAVGKDADRTLMDAIAHWGNGRSYYTDDQMHIPRIFTAETILISRSLFEEQAFQPVLQTEHELLRGIRIAQAPPLYGYVVTYGKPAAEMLLVTPKGDPLLAVQRYGLGRTAAFTSDLSTRWGKDWLRWPQFSQYAAQLVRWVQRKGTAESFDVQVDVREGQGIVQADVYDAQEHFLNNLDFQGRMLLPSQETLPITFSQIAPGRYQGRFAMHGNGEYLLSLTGKKDATTVGPKTVGISLPYSPEYLGLDINYGLLNRLADRTGGQVLRPDTPVEAAHMLFATTGQHVSALREYWPWFVTLALCLFVGEIAIRQILLPAAWIARLQKRESTPAASPPVHSYGDLEAIVHRRAEERHRRGITTSREPRDTIGVSSGQLRHHTLAGGRNRPQKS
ncbi:MAG TPA: VWA domain-containing protein [Candidatus Tectomicrobia bacterium]